MVHIHHRKKTSGGCIERLARSGSCRDSVRGVVGTMNAARWRPDWLATVQSGRKQAQSRMCTPGYSRLVRIIGFHFDICHIPSLCSGKYKCVLFCVAKRRHTSNVLIALHAVFKVVVD